MLVDTGRFAWILEHVPTQEERPIAGSGCRRPVGGFVNTPRRGASRREQTRAATLNEIKQTALGLIREHGTDGVRFTDIAKAMRMTPPALYWYFPDRNALLNALIADAGQAIGRRVAQALGSVADDDLFGQWQAVAQAYRHWAREEPQQFVLVREQRALVPLDSADTGQPADAQVLGHHECRRPDPVDDGSRLHPRTPGWTVGTSSSRRGAPRDCGMPAGHQRTTRH